MRLARITLTPRFTDFFTDFEKKKPIVLQSNILDVQEVTPPPDRKIIKLLTFVLLFLPLRYYR